MNYSYVLMKEMIHHKYTVITVYLVTFSFVRVLKAMSLIHMIKPLISRFSVVSNLLILYVCDHQYIY